MGFEVGVGPPFLYGKWSFSFQPCAVYLFGRVCKKVNSGLHGAGYEGMVMSQTLLSNAKSEFIISIVRNINSTQKVPLAFGSKLYIDFSNDTQYVAKYWGASRTNLWRRFKEKTAPWRKSFFYAIKQENCC